MRVVHLRHKDGVVGLLRSGRFALIDVVLVFDLGALVEFLLRPLLMLLPICTG